MKMFKKEIRIYGFEGHFCKDCFLQRGDDFPRCVLYGTCASASFGKQIRNPLCIQEESEWNGKQNV